MKAYDDARVDRLIRSAAGSLDPASLWFVATSAPDGEAALYLDPISRAHFQDWILGETGNWPAPLKIGERFSAPLLDEKLVFALGPDAGPMPAHHVELQANGSCLIAVQIGTPRVGGAGEEKVWAIGEGSIAWLSVAFVRLAAAWAAKSGMLGAASIDLRIFSSAPPERQARIQLWSFASGTNAPAGEARRMIEPCQRTLDLAAGLTGDVTLIAHSLLLPLLAQLGQRESRHINSDGSMISANFVGYAPAIAAWAQSIGASTS